jgi:hypothetical protein
VNFAENQNQYATVIECMGKSVLPSGKTLSEFLNIEEIPFWDVFAAEAAWRHLTTAVAATTPFENAKILIKPYVLRVRDLLNRISYARNSENCPPNWPAGPVVLCLGFTARMYRDILEPVVRRLTSESNCRVVVLSDSRHPVVERNESASVTFQSIEQYWSTDIERQSHRLRQSARLKEIELFSSGALENLFPEVNSKISVALRKVLYLLFKAYIPYAVRQAAIARHVLRTHHPSLVLSPDVSDTRTRLYTLLAGSMSIPSMEVQFGLTGDEGVEWRFLASDCVAVWGESSKAALVKQGVPEEKIIITGSPRHDILVRPSVSKLATTRAELGINGERPLILLASTYTDWTHTHYASPEILRAMKRAIFKAVEQNPDAILVVKPHPVEIVKETYALVGRTNNIIFVDRDSDIHDLIVMCDAFVSFGSTATVDALIAGKACICPIFPGWPFGESFRKAGVVFVPESPAQIEKIFFDITKNGGLFPTQDIASARHRFLADIACEADGLAAERIKEHLLGMMR